MSELISSQELEFVDGELDSFSNLEILFGVVLGGQGVVVSGSLQEFTSPDSGVLISDLIDLNSVIPAEE